MENTMEPVVIEPDVRLELGDCGMGMPVIRSYHALKKMPTGSILLAISSHP